MANNKSQSKSNSKIISSRTQEERNAIAKNKLYTAALELFAIHGYERTTLSEIGLRVGYSRGLAQYYFGTKEKLAEILLDNISKRDYNTPIQSINDASSAEEAWQAIELHTDTIWANYVKVLNNGDINLADRGELILSATAIFSNYEGLSIKMHEISNQLVNQITKGLKICMKGGLIREDINVHATAVFYVGSIWGLANILFAKPENANRLYASIGILKSFLNTLKNK